MELPPPLLQMRLLGLNLKLASSRAVTAFNRSSPHGAASEVMPIVQLNNWYSGLKKAK